MPFPGNRDFGSKRRGSNTGLSGGKAKRLWRCSDENRRHKTIGGVPLIKVRDLLRYMGAGMMGGETRYGRGRKLSSTESDFSNPKIQPPHYRGRLLVRSSRTFD
jgi:hypothetical protein